MVRMVREVLWVVFRMRTTSITHYFLVLSDEVVWYAPGRARASGECFKKLFSISMMVPFYVEAEPLNGMSYVCLSDLFFQSAAGSFSND